MSDEPRLQQILLDGLHSVYKTAKDTLDQWTHEAVWPEPREDPPQEPSHRAARIADRAIGIEQGDILDADRDHG